MIKPLTRPMSSTFLFSSKTSALTTAKHLTLFPSHYTSTTQFTSFSRRYVSAPVSVTSPSISYPQPVPPFNVDYLESEFGSHGVSFKDLGQSYVIKMMLENGSAASVLLPSGLITSYKPKMWHGSTVEILQTSVSEGKSGAGVGPVIQGGVSLSLEFADDEGSLWSPTSWVLSDVRGSPEESIQVEIMSRNPEKMVELKYSVTLKDDTLKSELNVSNLKSSELKLRGAIISHLTVSTPEAIYAFGLEGSNYSDRQPLDSNFCIIPPDPKKNKGLGTLQRLFSAKKNDEEETTEETAGEETDNTKHLTSKMSRIYTCAPRSFTIIDRGKRNSVIVGRKGFEELYLYSPGSSHESYSKYAYICVGQSALLRPVIIGPEQMWTGEQRLHNPNL